MLHPQPLHWREHPLPNRLNRLRKLLRLLDRHMRLHALPPHRQQMHDSLPRRAFLMLQRARPLHLPHSPGRRPRLRRKLLGQRIAEVDQVVAEGAVVVRRQRAGEREGAELRDGVLGEGVGFGDGRAKRGVDDGDLRVGFDEGRERLRLYAGVGVFPFCVENQLGEGGVVVGWRWWWGLCGRLLHSPTTQTIVFESSTVLPHALL